MSRWLAYDKGIRFISVALEDSRRANICTQREADVKPKWRGTFQYQTQCQHFSNHNRKAYAYDYMALGPCKDLQAEAALLVM